MKQIFKILFCLSVLFSCCQFAAAEGAPEAVIMAKDSVIRIYADSARGTCCGSGFVVGNQDSSALVVTNYHVVCNDPYRILLWLDPYEFVGGEIIAYSEARDLCLLRTNQPIAGIPLNIANNNAIQGDAVYALGFPSAADQLSDLEIHIGRDATVTDGIVSALRNLSVTGKSAPVKLLQTNAAINLGNSGGPLLNEKGEVVGVNTYGVADSQGIFGAIDREELASFLDEYNVLPKMTNSVPEKLILIIAIVITAAVCILAGYLFLRKSSFSWEKLLARAVLIFGTLLVLIYSISYFQARRYAAAGNYSNSSRLLIFPGITALHDTQLLDYLEAEQLLIKRQYEEAKLGFLELSGYLDSDRLALEADYYKAAQFADHNQYDEALTVYSFLASMEYRDSLQKIVETDYHKAIYINFKNQEYIEGSQLLMNPSFNDQKGIQELRSQAVELLYLQAQSSYQSGEYERAQVAFSQLKDYKDSQKYLLLLKARNPLNDQVSLVYVEDLKDQFDFEDTAEVLLLRNAIATDFLTGRWQAKSSSKYFQIDYNGEVSYNLPHKKNGDAYIIEGGMYLQFPEKKPDSAQALFSITAESPTCIKIHCYKDGKNYTLYRQ